MTLGRPASRTDVLFVLPHLGAGGAQRVVSIVADHLEKEGRTVAILTLLPRKPAFELPEGVRWIQPPRFNSLAFVTARRVRGAILRVLAPGARTSRRVRVIVRRARRAILRVLPDAIHRPLATWKATTWGDERWKIWSPGSHRKMMLVWNDQVRVRLISATVERLRPRAVMSLLTKTNVLTLLATSDTETRVVISERNRLIRPEPQRIRHLRAALYPACALVTGNALAVVEDLQKELGVAHARLLPNVIRRPPHKGLEADRENIISVVARLVPQKRVGLAIEAFAALQDPDSTWRLHIIGDGPEAERLQKLAQNLLRPATYTFFGHLDDPQPELERSRILVLPSAFEGTSNALLEAMICGVVPLVSEAADPRGDIIIEGATGRLFGAPTAPIATQLTRLVNQDDLPLMAKQAREVAERFTWDHQREAWENVLFGREAVSALDIR